MQKLEQIYSEAKEKMADSYANSIGKFYESLGQTEAFSDMKNSVSAVVDKKAAVYEDYLAQTDIYVKLDGLPDQWLKQDDAYMAARLRENFSSYKAEPEDQRSEKGEPDAQAPYSARDLSFAGAYARSLSEQLKRPDVVWNPKQSDHELGKYFAAREASEQKKIEDADIGDKLSNMLHTTFEPFMEKFLDALDHSIDEQKALVSGRTWMSGLIRTGHIDRDCVYASYQSSRKI